LTHPWIASGGYVRTNVSDTSYDNAIYYIVDLIEPDHDTVRLNTRVKIDSIPGYNELRQYCVFLATVNLSIRILGCFETHNAFNSYYYVYSRIRMLRYGSVTLLASNWFEGDSYGTSIRGTRDLSLNVVKINETHVNVNLTGTRRDGTSFSLPPVTVQINWNDLGYFGFYMSVIDTGFDFIDVWITSQYATSTVYYNINFPPPLPVITTTTTVTETKILEFGKDILVIPLGSFIRILSFGIYVVYIVKTIKHFTPEF
jgi:hypothetical protein